MPDADWSAYTSPSDWITPDPAIGEAVAKALKEGRITQDDIDNNRLQFVVVCEWKGKASQL